MAPLTGRALLAHVKDLGPQPSKTEMARSSGYVSITKNGSERVNYTAFYEALLQAKGMLTEPDQTGGRRVRYETKVQFNGNLMVGAAYTRRSGFEPGDWFKIRPTRNGFNLVRIGPGGDELDDTQAGDVCQAPALAAVNSEPALAAA